MSKKNVTLYNVIFPIWMMLIFPITWLVAFPVNFAIDLCVVYFSMKYLQVDDRRRRIKKVIWKVWIAGFLADIIGGFFMFSVALIDGVLDYNSPFGKWWYENLANGVMFNPFDSIWAVLWVTLCLCISGFCIYIFNKKFCLRKAELSPEQTHKVALALTVFTAPYLFYLPTQWFW